MAAPGLAEPPKKALATLNREWDGLTAHRDYPTIGLDNNKAERTIRGHGVTPDPGHANLRRAITGLPSTYPSSTATPLIFGLATAIARSSMSTASGES